MTGGCGVVVVHLGEQSLCVGAVVAVVVVVELVEPIPMVPVVPGAVAHECG